MHDDIRQRPALRSATGGIDAAALLPQGHRARRAVDRALWVSSIGAVIFVAFAYVTTQLQALRQGSPWQDDPYDAVVSFTELLVPALLLLIAARGWLYHRDQAKPLFRGSQLLRAAFVMTLLIAATVVVDWLAVALRADRALWDASTLWLIALLSVVTTTTLGALLALHAAFHDLPRSRPGRPDGDWLDDLGPLVLVLAGSRSERGRRLADLIGTSRVIRFLRAHTVALAAAVSLMAAVASTAAVAFGEGWTSPVLIVTDVAIGAGGFFAFCMICNSALQLAIPRGSTSVCQPSRRPTHRALWPALVAAAVALPTFAALRDVVWKLAGRGGEIDNASKFAAVCFGGALVTAGIVYLVALITIGRTVHRSGRRLG